MPTPAPARSCGPLRVCPANPRYLGGRGQANCLAGSRTWANIREPHSEGRGALSLPPALAARGAGR